MLQFAGPARQRQVSPPSPENRNPGLGLPRQDPRQLAKGVPWTSGNQDHGQTSNRPLGRVFYLPCCNLATYCFSYLLPPAANFFPVLLTTHCHATEYAHRTKRTEVPVISLTACLILIRFSWPHPLWAADSLHPYTAQEGHAAVTTTSQPASCPCMGDTIQDRCICCSAKSRQP